MSSFRLPGDALPQLGPGCAIPRRHPVEVIHRRVQQQLTIKPPQQSQDITKIAAMAAAQMPYRKIGR